MGLRTLLLSSGADLEAARTCLFPWYRTATDTPRRGVTLVAIKTLPANFVTRCVPLCEGGGGGLLGQPCQWCVPACPEVPDRGSVTDGMAEGGSARKSRCQHISTHDGEGTPLSTRRRDTNNGHDGLYRMNQRMKICLKIYKYNTFRIANAMKKFGVSFFPPTH